MTKIVKEPTSSFNPFYGCAILLMALLVFGGMITWSVYSLSKQDSEIAKFTVEQPIKPARQTLPEADVPALEAKLKAFADTALAAKPATLTLSVLELNTLIDIAPDTGVGSFKDMISFKTLKPGDSLVANVCLPLNKMKFWEGQRYAIGEATFVTEMVKETGPDMRLTDLTVPGKPVSPGFVEAFSTWHWLTPYYKINSVGPAMKAVKKIEVTAAGVVLSTGN